ncbi:MAG: serine hydroxymethyltransferase [Deltaproteobacteria bacterium]|nr:serine hydroxymethyltransferase [Deltaproteobacteria bacterium]
MPFDAPLAKADPEVYALIQKETERQEYGLELIASENFVSEAVLEAAGSTLTNKYAEGLPGKRYYGGCEVVDQVEQLAIDRAKKLFGAEHANVQPHAGSQANMATYFALFKPGDVVMSLSLAQGGHLTHGSPVNFSGRLFQIHHYGLDPKTEQIDYDAAARLAREVKPKAILCGASAYPRTLDFARLKEIAAEAGAVMVCDIAHIAGLVATGLHPSPVPLADAVTTTTHKTLRGPRSGLILSKAQHAKSIDSNVFPGIQGGPLEHIIAAKAVAFGEALQPEFKAYQQRILDNAKALAAALIEGGLRLVAGGTDTHLMLCDLRPKKLTGKIAESSLQRAHITTNKNMIPGDPEKPFVTSGLRLGTPALTTRGFGVAEMKKVGELIVRVLDAPEDVAVAEKVRGEVKELCQQFPLYRKRLA